MLRGYLNDNGGVPGGAAARSRIATRFAGLACWASFSRVAP